MSHSFGGSYEFNYEYDQNGNITRISDDSGNLRNEYTYDELGRLTSEINIPNGSQSSKAVVGKKIEYLYSKDGNIYQRNFYKVQALQGKAYVDAKANRSDSFGYSNTEWSDQLSSARINGKGFNFTYDKIGNPLSYRDGMVMTWQNGRQLKSIKVDDTTTLEFTYDINGQRQSKVEKKNGAAVHTTKYYYDGTKLVGENKDGTIVWYDYDENGTPVGMRLNGDDYVFRRNLQGDITGIFDSTGTLVVEYTYGNSWGFGITVSGSKAAEIGACNSLRYRGYYYDSESGLYYLNTRYYDPSICRFVNADELINQTDMQGFNLYSYCFNNPVVYVDPDGTCPYNGTAADFRNLEAGRPPMNCTCVGANVKAITTPHHVDLTEKLTNFMKNNRADMKQHLQEEGYLSAAKYFYDSVKSGGKWDVKIQPDWDLNPYDKYYFYGCEIRYDAPGNINYGYVGAYFFSDDILLFMAGAVQFKHYGTRFGNLFTYFDDPYDNQMIKCGILLYKERLI